MLEAREAGWLGSVFNAGQAVTLEAYARSEVEVPRRPLAWREGEDTFETLPRHFL